MKSNAVALIASFTLALITFGSALTAEDVEHHTIATVDTAVVEAE